jgi:hypothetical protein
MRLRFTLAVVAPALLGCAAFMALLPWGDPCALTTQPGEAGCGILLSPLQQNLRTAVFLALSLPVGLGAGLMSPSRRHLAGALSAPLAVLLSIIGVHLIYRIAGPFFRMDIPGSYVMALGDIIALAILGVIGGTLSRYVRLTIVGGVRERR